MWHKYLSSGHQQECSLYERVSDSSNTTDGISVWGPYREVLIPGYWIAEGGQSATGALLHHVLTSHAAHPAAKEAAAKEGVTVFEYLNNHLEKLRTLAKSPTISHLTRHFFRNILISLSNLSLSRLCRE